MPARCSIDRDYDITIDELMQVMPGPDFPTGGHVLGTGGIREAFATGAEPAPCRRAR